MANHIGLSNLETANPDIMKFYTAEELLEFPSSADQPKNKMYNGLILCPTGVILNDPEGFPEFAVIGCQNELHPKEIITKVHGLCLEGLLSPIKGDIKLDMIGPGIFRIWSNQYFMTFNLNSSETLDIDFVKR